MPSVLTTQQLDSLVVQKSGIEGKGLFAARRIAKGALIGVYEGPVTQKDGTHVLWVEDEDEQSFGIDGRNLLRFVNHMVHHVGEAPQFRRQDAVYAVNSVRQSYLEGLVGEEKRILKRLHPDKEFPDEEAAQTRMDSLLQGFKMFRYHNDVEWYDAHPGGRGAAAGSLGRGSGASGGGLLLGER